MLPYEQTVEGLMDACLSIELAAEKLYAELATLHSDDDEVSALWLKMAREEESHAAQFRLAMGNRGAMVTFVDVDPAQAQALLQSIAALCEQYRAQPPSVAEALAAAAKLEDDLARLHMNRVALFTQTSYRKLFEAMMAADRDHFGCLKKALARRSVER